MTHEEEVRSAWARVHTGTEAMHLSDYSAPIVITMAGEFPNWSAAAAFTRERLEQVRQLREEIAMVITLRDGYAKNGPSMGELREEALRRGTLCARTVARLESALATLTQGMKPEALQ